LKLPSIIITQQDADRLEALLERLSEQNFPGKEQLEAELDRATIVSPRDVPGDIVTMNSKVLFRTGEGKEFSLKLVYPKDSDGSPENISILAPVGSALLGLKDGDTISWPINGGAMQVQVIKVTEQPERDGNFAL
jgi:regulator of nucleoside diphosphate kinase